MASIDWFEQLGIFVARDFIGQELGKQYLDEASQQEGEEARLRRGDTVVADYKSRKTKQLKVSQNLRSLVREKLSRLKPSLEQHFQIRLNELTPPLFYRYEEGDFFGIHRDVEPNENAPESEQNRRISLILFVNGNSEGLAPNGYSGGELTLYGLVKDSRWAKYGFSLKPEPGLLIAFPSDVLHEVKPVTRGHRYTIVSWFT